MSAVGDKNNVKEITVRVGTDSFTVSTWGGSVISWVCNGQERLYLSPMAIRDGPKAIRGGIPIVFPQFGPGKMKQHGFARISNWTVAEQTEDSVLLTLSPNEHSSKMWGNMEFKLEYLVNLTDGKLTTSLRVHNPSKVASLNYDVCLHTYYLISHVDNMKVYGLRGYPYSDRASKGEEIMDQEAGVAVRRYVDRVYDESDADLVIADKGFKSRLIIKKSSPLKSTVLWNPWIERAKRTGDLPDEGYKRMMCVEPLVRGETLKAGLSKEYVVERECFDQSSMM